MLTIVKMALRITGTGYDTELNALIEAAFLDLQAAGVDAFTTDTADELVQQAVITYCKANFGDPDHAERFKASYDEQKAQLSMRTGYTEWEV